MKIIDPLTRRWGGLPISAHPVQSLSESIDWLPRFTKVPVSKFGFEENRHRVFVVSVDEDISEARGKLAAARLWSIATTGRDAAFAPPFAALPAPHRKVKPASSSLNISWRRSSRPDSRNSSNHEPHNYSEIRHAGPPLRHGNVDRAPTSSANFQGVRCRKPCATAPRKPAPNSSPPPPLEISPPPAVTNLITDRTNVLYLQKKIIQAPPPSIPSGRPCATWVSKKSDNHFKN